MDIPALDRLNQIIDKIPLFQLTDVLVISIEEKSIKMVELGMATAVPEVKNYAIMKLTVGDEIDDPTDNIVDTIQVAYEKGGFTAKNIFAVVMGGSVFLKKITLPKIPKAELNDAIRWEATNHIPFNVDTAYFDWEFLSTVKAREGVTNDEYMIAATDKSAVDFLIAVYHKLNLKLICIGLPSFALKNFVQGSAQFEVGKNSAVVDIGTRKTNIVVMRGKVLCFAREVPVGMDMLDDILRSELHSELGALSNEYIDNYLQTIRVKFNFAQTGTKEEEIIKGVTPQRIYGTFHTFVERLISELKRSFDYVKENAGQTIVDKVVLSGAGSRIQGIDQQIGNSFGIATEIVNPSGMFRFDPMTDKETFAAKFQELILPIGCAMGKLAQINFMPYSFITERRNKIYVVVLSALVLVNLIAGILVGTVLGFRTAQLKHTLVTESQKVEQVIPQILTLQNLCKEYATKKQVYDFMNEERVFLAQVLSEIALKVPKQISLKKLTFNKSILVLEGFVFDDKDSSQTKENLLVDFIIGLNESPFISQASLVLSEAGTGFDVDHNRFVVNCVLTTRNEYESQRKQ